MKLLLATLIHVLMAAVLVAGILLLPAGKPALLLVGVLGYGLLLGKVGCASH